MLFLSSLMFAALLYLIPGEMGLVLVCPPLAHFSGLPAWMVLTIMNVVVYVSIVIALYITKYAYSELQLEQERTHRAVKEFLSARGCWFLNLAGVVVIGVGCFTFLAAGRLPLPFVYLYVAIIIGFLDIFHKDDLILLSGDKTLPMPKVAMPKDDSCEPNATFKWEYKKNADEKAVYHETHIVIDQTEYEEKRGKGRYPQVLSEYARYVTEGETPSVVRLAWKLREISEESNYSAIQEVENIVSMVRSIPYTPDQATHERPDYANFPVETLREANPGSDCEDHAILAAALLDLLGHRVGLFHLDLADNGHIALGYVYDTDSDGGGFCRHACHGQTYYYIETVPTDAQNKIGDMPASFLEQLHKAEVIELV